MFPGPTLPLKFRVVFVEAAPILVIGADHSCGGSTGLVTGFPFHPGVDRLGHLHAFSDSGRMAEDRIGSIAQAALR